MTGDMEVIQQPNWILDKKESGCLYWRRETPEASKRVKFRCEVEVLEFWPSEDEWSENRKFKTEISEDMPPPSALVCAVCLCAMVATVSYTWLFPF